MNSLQPFSKQCPSCRFQLFTPKCAGGKTRGNQRDSGEYFKNVDCVLWQAIEKVVMSDSKANMCPTCGKPFGVDFVPLGLSKSKIAAGKIWLDADMSSLLTEMPEYIEEAGSVDVGTFNNLKQINTALTGTAEVLNLGKVVSIQTTGIPISNLIDIVMEPESQPASEPPKDPNWVSPRRRRYIQNQRAKKRGPYKKRVKDIIE